MLYQFKDNLSRYSNEYIITFTEGIVRCTMLATLPKVSRVCAEYDSPMVPLKSLIESEILPILLKAIAYEDKNGETNVNIALYSFCHCFFLNTYEFNVVDMTTVLKNLIGHFHVSS